MCPLLVLCISPNRHLRRSFISCGIDMSVFDIVIERYFLKQMYVLFTSWFIVDLLICAST